MSNSPGYGSSHRLSSSPNASPSLPTLTVAPAQVMRGAGLLPTAGSAIARYGQRPFLVGGKHSLEVVQPQLAATLRDHGLTSTAALYGKACSEESLSRLHQALEQHQGDVVIGIGGGKALDAAKLLAHQAGLPVVTIPTTAATCAAWTALSNLYSEAGAFAYDVSLLRCPDLLLLDYDVIATAPSRTLIAGIGDALAKWYEASVSSGHSQQTLVIAAVQQARVLRDLLLQKSELAIAQPGSETWREVVDATVLMAGMMGGLGGAECRTVAAHAVHNGLTHLSATPRSLHGEKVAYGILVQLRLEELIQGSQLAAAARAQLIRFYQKIGLPLTLEDLGLAAVSLSNLRQAALVACAPESDLHRLPFSVSPDLLMAALVSTTAQTQMPRTDSLGELSNRLQADIPPEPAVTSTPSGQGEL